MTLVRRPRIAFFFFNDTATPEIYTLSLHDALPISARQVCPHTEDRDYVPDSLWAGRGYKGAVDGGVGTGRHSAPAPTNRCGRSEEHTSELQSRLHLVCRLLLDKKKA